MNKIKSFKVNHLINFSFKSFSAFRAIKKKEPKLLFSMRMKMFTVNNKDKVDKDGFPTRESLEDDPDELIINIGPPEKFKGMLVICPTPIGNLNDLTIRQYEALKNGDILACEDTRKTGKLLELIQLKKMKDRFFDEFGIGFEEFLDRGGLNMTDEQMEKTILNTEKREKESFNEFYQTKKDVEEKIKVENKINQSSLKLKTKEEEEKKLAEMIKKVKENYSAVEKEKPKMDENVESKYFSFVKNSEDFKNRMDVIINSEDKIKEYVEPLADNYDDEMKLSYKLRSKAKFILGMTQKRDEKAKEKIKEKQSDKKPEEDEKDDLKSRFESNKHLDEDFEDYLSLEMGLTENLFLDFRRKIKEEKEKKGRGLMISLNQENEEKRIVKLIKAMKLGLRVVLLCNAGTPTVSDPGYRLVKEVAKQGIVIEPLPGPVAAITALSASSMPTDKFTFVGFLSKTKSEKRRRLEEIKASKTTTILYESPYRIMNTLEMIEEVFGGDHEVYLGIELTKKFENHFYGKIKNIFGKLEEVYKTEIRGEITLIIAPVVDEVVEDENSNLNEKITFDLISLAEKLNDNLKLTDKDMRNLLGKMCNISQMKAGNIVKKIRHPEGLLMKQFQNMKIDKPNFDPSEEYIDKLKEKMSTKKLKNIKILKSNSVFNNDKINDL